MPAKTTEPRRLWRGLTTFTADPSVTFRLCTKIPETTRALSFATKTFEPHAKKSEAKRGDDMAEYAKPNLLIADIQKSGSASFYRFLAYYPEIYMSPTKEPNFVNTNKEDSESFRAYLKNSTRQSGQRYIGEATPNCEATPFTRIDITCSAAMPR